MEDGCLRFRAAGSEALPSGDFGIPFQTVSIILLGPGSTVTHDALRLTARHGTGLLVVGNSGVRLYASLPDGMNDSSYARRQVQIWSDPVERMRAVRLLYAWRLGEIFPTADITVLRGMEGARMRETYKLLAQKFGIKWKGRVYDRTNPDNTDDTNQAINHAATAVEGAAAVAIAVTSTIPQLGFIHEASSNSFTLDIADLFRDTVTLPVAFQAIRDFQRKPSITLERHVRRQANIVFRQSKLIDSMISRIKALITQNIDGKPTVALTLIPRDAPE